jgi:hypothetical protein
MRSSVTSSMFCLQHIDVLKPLVHVILQVPPQSLNLACGFILLVKHIVPLASMSRPTRRSLAKLWQKSPQLNASRLTIAENIKKLKDRRELVKNVVHSDAFP